APAQVCFHGKTPVGLDGEIAVPGAGGHFRARKRDVARGLAGGGEVVDAENLPHQHDATVAGENGLQCRRFDTAHEVVGVHDVVDAEQAIAHRAAHAVELALPDNVF